MPSPDHEIMPTLRAGVFYGSPSRFPVPFLATPQQRSLQRSIIPMVANQLPCHTVNFPIDMPSRKYSTRKNNLKFPCVPYFSASVFLRILILLKNKILRCSCEVIVHQHRYEHQRPYSSSIPSHQSKQRKIASHPSYDILYPALVLFAAWLYTACSCG